MLNHSIQFTVPGYTTDDYEGTEKPNHNYTQYWGYFPGEYIIDKD